MCMFPSVSRYSSTIPEIIQYRKRNKKTATTPNAKFTVFALEANANRVDICRVADGI